MKSKTLSIYSLICSMVSVLIIVFSLTFLLSDNFKTRQSPKELDSILSAVVPLTTIGKFTTNSEKDTILEEEIYGTGVHIGNGYILTLTHCTKLSETKTIFTPFGISVNIKREVLSNTTKIKNGNNLELIGRHREISLFKSSDILPTSLSLGSMEDIKMGKEVIIICNAHAAGLGFRIGHIYSTNLGKTLFNEEDRKEVFAIDCTVIQGTSGGPVLLYTKDGIKMIGIAAANLRGGGMSFAFKLDYIKEGIKIIKEGKK